LFSFFLFSFVVLSLFSFCLFFFPSLSFFSFCLFLFPFILFLSFIFQSFSFFFNMFLSLSLCIFLFYSFSLPFIHCCVLKQTHTQRQHPPPSSGVGPSPAHNHAPFSGSHATMSKPHGLSSLDSLLCFFPSLT
jgi:hypothetical protein